MNLRQIEAFQAVMMTGSITAAAELLCVSQPAVSRLIADLEESTGLSLFQRMHRRVVPTPEAVTLHDEANQIFNGLSLLKRKALDIRNFNTGRLRIASLPSLGTGFVPEAISAFSEIHPNVTFSLQVQMTGTVVDWANAHQFDLGLVGGPMEASDVDVEVFAEVNSVCVMPRDHRLAAKTSITIEDLENEAFVSLASNDIGRHRVDRVFQDAGVARSMNIETQFAATICNFVLHGRGVSLVSPFSAIDFRDRGLCLKRFEGEVPVQYLLVFPKFRAKSSLARRFIDVLCSKRDEKIDRFRELGLI